MTNIPDGPFKVPDFGRASNPWATLRWTAVADKPGYVNAWLGPWKLQMHSEVLQPLLEGRVHPAMPIAGWVAVAEWLDNGYEQARHLWLTHGRFMGERGRGTKDLLESTRIWFRDLLAAGGFWYYRGFAVCVPPYTASTALMVKDADTYCAHFGLSFLKNRRVRLVPWHSDEHLDDFAAGVEQRRNGFYYRRPLFEPNDYQSDWGHGYATLRQAIDAMIDDGPSERQLHMREYRLQRQPVLVG